MKRARRWGWSERRLPPTPASGVDSGMIQELLSRYFRSARPPGVVAVFLHGSQATGTAHRESDVDVGVLLDPGVFPDRGHRSRMRVSLTAELIQLLGVNAVDVLVLNDVPPTLGRAVATRGILLFVADHEALREYELQVQLRAPDLERFLARMRPLMLKALQR
ncbi:MAG: nucleotidyltransferase domain-containing protein [Gemmatimonadota bacterium]